MKIYLGKLKQLGIWRQRGNSNGGTLDFITLDDKIIRELGCPQDTYGYLHQTPYETNIKLYTQYILIFGTQVIGVKNMDTNARFLWSLKNLIASVIFAYLITLIAGLVIWFLIGQNSPLLKFLFITAIPLFNPALAIYAYVRAKND